MLEVQILIRSRALAQREALRFARADQELMRFIEQVKGTEESESE